MCKCRSCCPFDYIISPSMLEQYQQSMLGKKCTRAMQRLMLVQSQRPTSLLQHQEGRIRTHKVRYRSRYRPLHLAPYFDHGPLTSARAKNRSDLPLLLEHKTALRLRNSILPQHNKIQTHNLELERRSPVLYSHNLGRHHPLLSRTLASKHLHPPRHNEQAKRKESPRAEESQREGPTLWKEGKQRRGERRTTSVPPRHERRDLKTLEPETKIPDHDACVYARRAG